MSDYVVFSTAQAFVYSRLSPDVPTLTRVNVGSPPAPTGALAYAFDSSPATVVDTTYTDGSNRSYLRCDFGAAALVGAVFLRNVTCSGTVAVYGSNTAITNGDFTGATAFATSNAQPATGAPLLFLPGSGTTVSCRYVYIVCATAGFSVGDIDIRGERVEFAIMQNLAMNFGGFLEALLRGPCWLNEQPVASTRYDHNAGLQAEHAIFSPKVLAKMSGAVYANDGTTTTDTYTNLTVPTAFGLDLTLKALTGKNIIITFFELTVPGLPLQVSRDKFAVSNFQAVVRFSDPTAIPYRIEVEI